VRCEASIVYLALLCAH